MPHRTLLKLLRTLAFAASLLGSGTALAQDAPPDAVEEPAPAVVSPSQAPFMRPLGRLAGILGSVHFLSTLCGTDEGGLWRDRMNDLIVAQRPNDADRRILVAQFNSGYRAFEATYRQCTPSAEVAMRRYLEEGATLSRDISARYGN